MISCELQGQGEIDQGHSQAHFDVFIHTTLYVGNKIMC